MQSNWLAWFDFTVDVLVEQLEIRRAWTVDVGRIITDVDSLYCKHSAVLEDTDCFMGPA